MAGARIMARVTHDTETHHSLSTLAFFLLLLALGAPPAFLFATMLPAIHHASSLARSLITFPLALLLAREARLSLPEYDQQASTQHKMCQL